MKRILLVGLLAVAIVLSLVAVSNGFNGLLPKTTTATDSTPYVPGYQWDTDSQLKQQWEEAVAGAEVDSKPILAEVNAEAQKASSSQEAQALKSKAAAELAKGKAALANWWAGWKAKHHL
jgi:hypothetical protein